MKGLFGSKGPTPIGLLYMATNVTRALESVNYSEKEIAELWEKEAYDLLTEHPGLMQQLLD